MLTLMHDLVHALRTLLKARAFTAICVISLGIGMGAIVALATFSRAISSPAHGIATTGLVEVLMLPEGPLRAKAGTWAIDRWSYPDYQVLRSADIGMELTGWSLESSEFGDAPAYGKTPPARVSTKNCCLNSFDRLSAMVRAR